MTSDEIVFRDRLHIIKHFFEHTIKVTELCIKFQRSRTWFYKWHTRYLAYGEEGLRNIDRGSPAMPNQTPVNVETAILDFVCRFPAYGPQRIADELTLEGTPVK